METQTSITLSRVLESGILDKYEISESFMHMGVRKLGGEWFKDQKSGKAYGVVEDDDGNLRVAQVTESKAKASGKAKRIMIRCIECDSEREVATQDAFQVKRCLDCQRKYRNVKRRERAKIRRSERRKSRELDALNGDSEVEPEGVLANQE